VAKTWTANSHPFDPVAGLGGACWLRVVTEPSVLAAGSRALGRHVSELQLGDCLRGSMSVFAPLVCKMTHLRVLHLQVRGQVCECLPRV